MPVAPTALAPTGGKRVTLCFHRGARMQLIFMSMHDAPNFLETQVVESYRSGSPLSLGWLVNNRTIAARLAIDPSDYESNNIQIGAITFWTGL
jgi:hypothetical protein